MPLTSLMPTATVKKHYTDFFEISRFFCTITCWGKCLVDSFNQSKHLKNVNSEEHTCIKARHMVNKTYNFRVVLKKAFPKNLNLLPLHQIDYVTWFQKKPFADVLQNTVDVLKNSANFTGKHLCWTSFFKKLLS